jgi:hypothetical protein
MVSLSITLIHTPFEQISFEQISLGQLTVEQMTLALMAQSPLASDFVLHHMEKQKNLEKTF